MDSSWHVVLRDITVILAASAVILTTIFTVLVFYQLYKLGRVLHEEVQPISDVRGSAAYRRVLAAEFVRRLLHA